MSAFYRFAYIVVNIWLGISGWHIYGKENIPCDRSYIIIANHRRYTDPALIGCAFPRQVRFLYKSEFAKSNFASSLFNHLRAIPLERGAADLTAMKTALKSLKEGYAVGLFPEGTRNKTGTEVQPFEEGAAFMAYRAGVPIVPVAILNSENVRSIFKRDVTLVIGKPITIKTDKEHLREDLERYNEVLREQVTVLLNEGQRLLKK